MRMKDRDRPTPVSDWIEDVTDRIRGAIDPPNWPEAGSEECITFAEAWADAFTRERVTKAEAEAAVNKLAACPPKFRREYLPAVLLLVREARGGGVATATSRETAAAKSAGCRYCHGQGMTTVWRSDPDPEIRGPATVAAYCECALGLWVESNHRSKEPEVHRKTPTIRDVLAGRGPWRMDPPKTHGSPDPIETQAMEKGAWAEVLRKTFALTKASMYVD